MEPGASAKPIGAGYVNPANPVILQGAHGLAVEGLSVYRHFVALSYRTDSLPHVAVMTKEQAVADFLAGRPWSFRELVPPALEHDWDADLEADDAETAASMTGDDAAGPHPHDAVADGGDRTGDDGGDVADAPVMVTTWDGAADDLLPGETRRLYSIGIGGNASYEVPRMRYSFSSYTRPGELHELDPATGRDVLLKNCLLYTSPSPRD